MLVLLNVCLFFAIKIDSALQTRFLRQFVKEDLSKTQMPPIAFKHSNATMPILAASYKSVLTHTLLALTAWHVWSRQNQEETYMTLQRSQIWSQKRLWQQNKICYHKVIFLCCNKSHFVATKFIFFVATNLIFVATSQNFMLQQTLLQHKIFVPTCCFSLLQQIGCM